MDKKARQMLKNLFWSWINPRLESYSDQMEQLLDTLTDEQLVKFVRERAGVDKGVEDEE